MDGYVQFALVTFASVLFIIDPTAVIPTYLCIPQGQNTAQRQATSRRACSAAAILLIVFSLAGRLSFELFGITMPAFRIAGGLILWLVATDMLHGARSTQEGTAEITEGHAKEDVALTPLAMPMLAGPGAISTVMVLAGQAHHRPEFHSLLLQRDHAFNQLGHSAACRAIGGSHGAHRHSRDDAHHGTPHGGDRSAICHHGRTGRPRSVTSS